MIDDFLFSIAIHFLIIMLVLVEHPFEIRHSLPEFYLFPDLTIVHDLAHQLFIIIAFHHCKSQLVAHFHLAHLLYQILLDSLLGIYPDPVRQTCRITVGLLVRLLSVVVCMLFLRLLPLLEIVDVDVLGGPLFADEEGDLFWVGRCYFFAD